MNLLLLWSIIFLLGLILYFIPVFFYERRYEGFEDSKATTLDDPTKYLKELRSIFEPQTIGTPDFNFTLDSPTFSKQEDVDTKGTKSIPNPATVTRSEPSVPNPPPLDKTPIVEQGTAFKQLLPIVPVIKNNLPSKITDVVPLPKKENVCPPPVCPPPVCPPPVCPRQVCPKPQCPVVKCPKSKCPDMRDFIRKDSIPCWACKIK